jgi:hypothetical protein
MMKVEPQKQHRWLQKLLGEWVSAGGEEHLDGWTESFGPVGEVWVQGVSHGPTHDGPPAKTVVTLGYNPNTQKFVGTWIGSMMDHLWVYEGELSEDEQTLVLEAVGPRFDGTEGMATYRDEMEILDENTRELRSSVLGDDGVWTTFMTNKYQRA